MNKLLLDVRYVCRLLAKSPAFALTSLLIIVLGIVLYLCSYTLVYNFSDRPLPFEGGNRFVAVKTVYKNSGAPHFGSNFDHYAANYLKQRVTSYEDFYAYRSAPATLSDGEFPQQFTGGQFEPGILASTQTPAFMGRLLVEEDAYPGAQPVAVISYDVWQNYYAKDPDIIGRTSLINGDSYVIVGVMPRNFDYPNFQDIWLPFQLDRGATANGIMVLGVVGKLKTAVSISQASQEIDELMNELVSDYPEYYSDSPNAFVGPHTSINQTNDEISALLKILQYTILSLLVVNLGILLFYRAHTRQRELAVRCAMGASPWQVSKQILLESAILCGLGLVISLGLASIALYVIEGIFVRTVSQLLSWVSFSIDLHSLSVAIFVTVSLWLLSGLWVALRTARLQPHTILASGAKGSDGKSSHWTTRLVVGLEVIASTFLLIVCSLVATAIFRLYDVDFGVATENRLTASIQMRGSDYDTVEERWQFVQDLQVSLASEPAFASTTMAFGLPGQWGELYPFSLEDRDTRQNGQYPFITTNAIDNNYFSALSVPLIEGRAFNNNDTAESPLVTIIDEQVAKQLWPNESAIGKNIGLTKVGTTPWLTVVGVNQHIIHGGPARPQTQPVLYRPISQFTPFFYSFALELTHGISQAEGLRKLQDIVATHDRNIAVLNPQSLQEMLERTHAGFDIVAHLAMAFGIATFIFSLIGVYGLIARSVAARKQEVGIRKSLGSTAAKILFLFLRQGAWYLAIGSSIGGLAAIYTSGLLVSLFGNLLDTLPLVAGSVLVVMAIMILLASYLPAREAVAMEPGDALREE